MVNRAFNVSATNEAIILKLSLHVAKTSDFVIDSESSSAPKPRQRHKGRRLGGFGYEALTCASSRSSACGTKERNSGVQRRARELHQVRGPVIRQSLRRLPSQLRCPRYISATLGQDTGHAASRAWLITAVAYHQQQRPAMQEEAATVIGAPNRRVADLEVESAIRKGAVFLFIKP